MPVSAHAEKGDDARTVASRLGGKAAPARDELRRRELVRARRGARDEIGEPAALAQQDILLPWPQPAWRESGRVQRRPEAVARASEMIARCRGVQARIDAAE